MASAVTTFGIFQALLNRAVNADASLDSATRASMLVRIQDLARDVGVALDFSSVDSTGGLASVSEATRSIEVASGVTGANRVEWEPLTFSVPVVISGGAGTRGFLAGHVGASANAAVDSADISMQYRTGASEAWKAFDRNTVVDGASWIQFAANIADQVAAKALPALNLVARQV